MKLSKDEITKEIRNVGADESVFVNIDPANLKQRCEQAHEILVKSGWPNEPKRVSLKDRLAADHRAAAARETARQAAAQGAKQ